MTYDHEFRPLATMAEAHREWHLNAGVPMGQPGCPQDACDPPEEYGDTHWADGTPIPLHREPG